MTEKMCILLCDIIIMSMISLIIKVMMMIVIITEHPAAYFLDLLH